MSKIVLFIFLLQPLLLLLISVFVDSIAIVPVSQATDSEQYTLVALQKVSIQEAFSQFLVEKHWEFHEEMSLQQQLLVRATISSST